MFGRKADSEEMEMVRQQYQLALDRYQEDPSSAKEFLSVGDFPLPKELDESRTAALAMVTNTWMSFDEAYMKR